MKLFDARPQDFVSAEAVVYQKKETVRYLIRTVAPNPVTASIHRKQTGPPENREKKVAEKRKAA